VTAIERPLPPLNADERTVLESWLDFHRATLAMKCEGLDDEQAASASVSPSGFTLTGLVQHMAEVERNWFRRVLAGEQAPILTAPTAASNWPKALPSLTPSPPGARRSPTPASTAPPAPSPIPAASWART
jgi:Protein of unknown function (DUF664)